MVQGVLYMFPIWAHAYSHRMMTSYTCQKMNRRKRSEIRTALNSVTEDKAILFLGKQVFIVYDDEMTPLEYSRKQIGCCLWQSANNRTDLVIKIVVKGTEYIYKNPPTGGGKIKFFKGTDEMSKDQWFQEVFPDMDLNKPTEDALLNKFGCGQETTIDITKMDLTFEKGNLICEINDNLGSPFSCLLVNFNGRTIDVSEPEAWFRSFIAFFLKWSSLSGINNNTDNFMGDYRALVDEAKEMVMAVEEFKQVIDDNTKVSSKPEVDSETDSDSEPVAYISDSEGSESRLPLVGRLESIDLNEESQRLDANNLSDRTDIVTCIDTQNGEQVAKQYKRVKETTITLVKGSEKSTVIRPSPNLDAVLATVVPADEEFKMGDEPPTSLISWETVGDSIRCSNECVEIVDTDPSEYSQALTEFIPTPDQAMEWKRMKYKKKDGKVGNGFLADPHQMHSIIYGGSKLLIAHRPGFGKTINSILHAEKLRNNCTGPKPKILILAPSRKLLMHWIRELDRLEMDKSHYIWSTYKHFMYTQTRYLAKKSTGTYPEYHLLSENVRKELGRLLQEELRDESGVIIQEQNYRLDGEETELGLNLKLKTIPKVKGVGQTNYGGNKNHCMICGRAVSLKECEGYVNYKKLERMWRFDSTECVTHHLHLTSSRMIKIQFMWRKHEDKIFFTCKDHNEDHKSHFITGFQCKDINPKSFTDLKKQVEKENEEQTVELQTVKEYIENERAAYDDYLQKLRKISKMPDASAVEIKKALNEQTGELGLSYFTERSSNEIYHMYRAPDDCILIADEIHTQVKNKHNNVMDCLWKYCLKSRFTILASATPIESNEETKQMYLLSEMLRTNREYTDKVFPPWHPLRVWDTNKDIFTLSSGLKSKISRLNTVEDVEKAVDFFVNGDVFDNTKSLYDLDPTNILNLFLGISGQENALKTETWFKVGRTQTYPTKADVPEDKRDTSKAQKYIHWLGTTGNDTSELQKSGEKPYAFVDGDLVEYRNTAIKTLYRKRQLDDTRPKLFPDKVAYEGGYINVPNDEIRLSMMLRRPIPELRFELSDNEEKYNVNVSENTIRVTKSEEGTYTAKEILDLQQLCFSNLLPGLVAMVYEKPEQKLLPNRVVCANYLISKKTRPYEKTTVSNKVYMELGDKLKPNTELKWLNVCPTEKKTGEGSDKKEAEVHYNNIPFLPGLMSSKIVAIVETIEKAYTEGKNIMVYHPRVEMHRAVQRLLAMRGHVSANEFVENDDGRLKEHQKRSAIKRWAIINDGNTIREQSEKYKIYGSIRDGNWECNMQEINELIKPYREMMDWEVIFKTVEEWKNRSIWGIYSKIGPSKLKTLNDALTVESISVLSILKLYNEMFRYFDFEDTEVYNEVAKQDFDNLIDAALKIEYIPKKVKRLRREEIQGALAVYEKCKELVFTGEEQKIFLECERYFDRAIKKIVSKKITTKTIKKKDGKRETKAFRDWWVNNKKLRVWVYDTFGGNLGDIEKEIELRKSEFGLGDTIKKWSDTKCKKGRTPDLPFDEIKDFLKEHKEFFEHAYFKSDTSKLTFNRIRLISEITNTDPMHMKMNDARIGEIGAGYKVSKGDITDNPIKMDNLDDIVIDNNNHVITLWCYIKGFFQTDFYKNIGKDGNLFPDIWEGGNGQIIYKDSDTTDDQLRLEAARRELPDGEGRLVDRLNALGKVTNMSPKGEITIEEYNTRIERLKRNPYFGEIKTKGLPSLRLNYQYYVDNNGKSRQWYDNWNGEELITRPGLEMVQRLGVGGDRITKKDFFDSMSRRITGLHQRWNGKGNKMFYGVLTGDVSKKNYDAFVDAFSTGKIDCLFVSDAGIEGIDYKSPAPSLMISIDPVKSPGKMDQFTGRTIRRNSHQTLPRDMRITEYVSFCTKKYEKKDTRKEEYIGEDLTSRRIMQMRSKYLLEFTKKYKENKGIVESPLSKEEEEVLKRKIDEGIKDLQAKIKEEIENPTGEVIDLRSKKYSRKNVMNFKEHVKKHLSKWCVTFPLKRNDKKKYEEWYETHNDKVVGSKESIEAFKQYVSENCVKFLKRTNYYIDKPLNWEGKLSDEYDKWYATQDKGPTNRVNTKKTKDLKDEIAEIRKETRQNYFESIGKRLGVMTEEEKKVFNNFLENDQKYRSLSRRYEELHKQEQQDNKASKEVEELAELNRKLTETYKTIEKNEITKEINKKRLEKKKKPIELETRGDPKQIIKDIISVRKGLGYPTMTTSQIKKDRDPNNPKTMTDDDITTEIQMKERIILNGRSNSQIIGRINQLGKELADRDGKKWNKRTGKDYTENKRTLDLIASSPYDLDEPDDIDSEDEDDEKKFEKIEYPDNKKWNHYIDNYVNISHVPVHNNIAFLSVGDYDAYMDDIREENEKIKVIPKRITRSSEFANMTPEDRKEIRKTSERAKRKLEHFNFIGKFFCHACNWFSGGVTMEERKKAYEEHKSKEPYQAGLGESNKKYEDWFEQNELLKEEYAKVDRCERCNTELTRWDGEKQNILYYHLMKPRKGIFDDKEKFYRNENQKAKAEIKRVQRDRLEMAMAMNSVEHQARHIGKKVFKFSSVDGVWEKNFYKAINREGFDLTEEERKKSWYSFIKSSIINDPKPEPEPIQVKLMSGQGFEEMIPAETKVKVTKKGTRRRGRKGAPRAPQTKGGLALPPSGDEYIPSSDSEYESGSESESEDALTTYVDEPDDSYEKQVKAILENGDMSPETKYAALIAIGYDPGLKEDTGITKQLGGASINLNQYDTKEVAGDGNCMYHSIIAATKHIGVAPGNEKEMTPTKLRQELINGMGDCTDLINQIDEINDEILNDLKKRIIDNEWGGSLEARFIQCLYSVPITIVDKNTGQITNFVDIDNGGIVLIYANRNHYNWLCLKPCTESPSLSTEEYLSDASIQSEY